MSNAAGSILQLQNVNGEFVETTSNFNGEASTPQTSTKTIQSVSMMGDTVTNNAVVTNNTMPVADEHSDNLLSTVMSSTGSVASELNGNCTVAYQGTRITLDTAVTMGLITKNPDGTYSEQANKGLAVEQSQEGNDNPIPEGVELLPQEAENKIQALMDVIPEPFLNSAVADFTNTFELTPQNVEQIANNSGLQASAVSDNFSAVHAAFQNQADQSISKLGVDPQAVYEWAKSNHKAELQDAVRSQIYQGSVKGYQALADKYMRSNAPSAETINKAGISTRTEGKETLVRLSNGMEVTTTVAAKLGLI